MASVLVCDDEPVVAELLSTLLESCGYLVPVARNGEEAVALAHLHRPDLLLLDMELPDMSGLDILRKIRDEPNCHDTAAIFLTGVEDEANMTEAVGLGGVTYLLKREMRSRDLLSLIGNQMPTADQVDSTLYPFVKSSHEASTGDREATPILADPDRTLTCVGSWSLRQKIGRGGMGDVYVAEQGEYLSAIKVLPKGYDPRGEVGQRFLREISILRRLDHPHIVRYLDSGIAFTRPYLIMDLVDAPNLRQFTAMHGCIDAATARVLLCQVASALSCARDQGITHRDIKPSNILVSGGPHPGSQPEIHAHICDFGIAHIRDSMRKDGDGEDFTKHGMLMGTPAYVSPEQAGGQRSADQRQDIYGLGATLYAAITGAPPFRGRIEDMLLLKQTEDVDLEPLNVLNDPALVACIGAMLLRDPERRVGTWEAVIATSC